MKRNKNSLQAFPTCVRIITGMDDVELVRRALQNPDEYVAIVERFEHMLLRFIRSLSQLSRQDAEDIAQQVFLKAYEHLNDFDQELRLSTWLFRIARNEVISGWRKKQARPQECVLDDLGLNTEQKIEASMAEDFDQKITMQEVRDILALLQPHYREVLYLHYFEEKKYEEIADIICAPSGTVAALISRAKKAFSEVATRTNKVKHLITAL